MTSIIQNWVHNLPIMQQGVMLCAIRGPDNIAKYHPSKFLLRWFRRAILVHSFEGHEIPRGSPFTRPDQKGGGSFLGPSYENREGEDWRIVMDERVDEYLRTVDELPHHFHTHFMHAIEILGYRHPVPEMREWWHKVYVRFCNDMHLPSETEEHMALRLGDNLAQNLAMGDTATNKDFA